jgi:hypothetical protein
MLVYEWPESRLTLGASHPFAVLLSGNTVSYRYRLFEAAPVRVRFHSAIGS